MDTKDHNKPTLPDDYVRPTFSQALQSLIEQAERANPTALFLVSVWDEIERARLLFPNPDGMMVALAEETGETAKALLGKELPEVYKEAAQVACVATRLAVEGDPTQDPHRSRNKLTPSYTGPFKVIPRIASTK